MYQTLSHKSTVSLSVMFVVCDGRFRVAGLVRGVLLGRLRRAFA
jgi:hypothetical protein